MTVHTSSAEETVALGRALGERLGPGDVVALFGGLGAGKTTMTKGIAFGAGVSAEVHSPTFTLIHEHPGRVPFYHLDLYRMAGDVDASMLGIDEYIYGEGIAVVEWADRAPGVLPDERIEIRLSADEDRREIEVTATSERLQKVLESVDWNARTCD